MAHQVSRCLVVIESLAACAVVALSVRVLLLPRPVTWAPFLLIPGVPLLLAAHLWVIAGKNPVIRRGAFSGSAVASGPSRLHELRRAPRWLLIAVLAGLFISGVVAFVQTSVIEQRYPRLKAGITCLQGSGPRRPQGCVPVGDRHLYGSAGERFAFAVIGGFFLGHVGELLGEAEGRRRVSTTPS
jgi:hypothetical protein